MGGATAELGNRGVALCRDIIGPQEVIETMMLQDPKGILSRDVHKALETSSAPYKKLVAFYQELCALQKHHSKSSASSSDSGSVASLDFKSLVRT